MILGTDEIRSRVKAGQIFRYKTSSDEFIKEASYALRVANHGMVVNGDIFEPGNEYPHSFIELKAGRIAILSTVEQFCMPEDLVGKLGVRLEFASQGITGLMGIQVDPYYGLDYADEPLYIKVANFGSEDIKIRPGDPVFNIEFSTVEGAEKPDPPKGRTWSRVMEGLKGQQQIDWTYMARVDTDAQGIETRLMGVVNGIRDSQQSVVMFGVFLVAITILAAFIGVILNVKDAPTWLTNTGWIFLLILCTIATIGIVVFVVVAGLGFWKITNGSRLRRTQPSSDGHRDSDRP